ncbi:alpha/beta fold hydrolase [Gaetbulibacter aestuarii]|uniref:Alpha/beta hydrolase n=1 Tax=Gaetbulibacter aestuarii TaxID=1502358 RepID=A0ABW7MVR6_9FLAO
MNIQNFTYKGIPVSYSDDGAGEVILLLHGFLESKLIWQPFIKELARKNRVITMDLLGHGQTGCLGYIHSMELMAEPIIELLENLKVKDCIVLGHSMGGYVALAFAENRPDLVKKIGLINSTSREDSKERKRNRDRAVKAVKENPKRFIRMGIPNLFCEENRTVFTEAIKKVTEAALKTPTQGIIAALEGMKIRPERTHFLSGLNVPKLMIASKKDPVLDFKALKKEAEEACMTLVVFPDGHMSFIENKDEFSKQIMYFIE